MFGHKVGLAAPSLLLLVLLLFGVIAKNIHLGRSLELVDVCHVIVSLMILPGGSKRVLTSVVVSALAMHSIRP